MEVKVVRGLKRQLVKSVELNILLDELKKVGFEIKLIKDLEECIVNVYSIKDINGCLKRYEYKIAGVDGGSKVVKDQEQGFQY